MSGNYATAAPKLVQHGLEDGTDLGTGFRPQIRGRIPAPIYKLIWGGGIRSRNRDRNPVLKSGPDFAPKGLPELSFFGRCRRLSACILEPAYALELGACYSAPFPHMSGNPPNPKLFAFEQRHFGWGFAGFGLCHPIFTMGG